MLTNTSSRNRENISKKMIQKPQKLQLSLTIQFAVFFIVVAGLIYYYFSPKFEEEVLDIDVIVRACQAQAGSALERATTRVVEFADKRLQANIH